MGSPLDSTFGLWLVSIWLQTLLQGCGLLQAWLYFHWYSKDHWAIRAMVASLVVVETFQIIVYFQVTYLYFIDDFGSVPGLFIIHWQDSIQLFAMYLSAFIVQMYFAYCIYAFLEKKKKLIPIIIVVLALTGIGSGLAQTLITIRMQSFEQLDSTKAITTLQAACALVCDITITSSLVCNLGKHKGRVKSTDSMLHTLMVHAINRGMLTAICAALNMILFLALPGTFYFFIGLTLSSKLYMNSALATLNSRQHVVKKAHMSDPDWTQNAIPMETLSIGRSTNVNEDGRLQIIVNNETRTDSDYKRQMFTEGML
ncbi:hypothetical protein BDZ97DRAFT_1924240 [Flammula alnicola]|nr:hypothetical protein BDZ97DRAFT_1924240 [Flammula alnicola]